MSAQNTSIQMDLNLFIWMNDQKPEGLPNGAEGQTMYAKRGTSLNMYHYCYCYSDGTVVSGPLTVPASTEINISMMYGKADQTTSEPSIFACMVNESKTGTISHFFMQDQKDQNVPMAESLRPSSHNFTVTGLNTPDPLKIQAGITTPGAYRITLFASFDGVIVPCDPEVDDVRDPMGGGG